MRYIISFVLASVPAIALAEVPRVVADIPPVQALVAQVMGDLGTPTLLLDRGASEHDFQLRPSQAAVVAEAGLIVRVGPELTPWLDRVLTGPGAGVPVLGLLAVPGTELAGYGDDVHDHGGQDHDGHDHEGIDPHAWLDPYNARVWLAAIAAELSRIDPANAAAYAANAANAAAGIDALDAEVAALLAPVQGRPIVVFHDAYGYFARHYGLTVAAALTEGDASAPGAARLRDIEQTLADSGAVCAFPEPQHDPALLMQLAEATGLTLGAPIDPVGALLDPGPGAYAALMTGLARSIADCAAR